MEVGRWVNWKNTADSAKLYAARQCGGLRDQRVVVLFHMDSLQTDRSRPYYIITIDILSTYVHS